MSELLTVEYLGTGPNPINVPKLRSEKPLNKGDRAYATEKVATDLRDQGLFTILGKAEDFPIEVAEAPKTSVDSAIDGAATVDAAKPAKKKTDK